MHCTGWFRGSPIWVELTKIWMFHSSWPASAHSAWCSVAQTESGRKRNGQNSSRPIRSETCWITLYLSFMYLITVFQEFVSRLLLRIHSSRFKISSQSIHTSRHLLHIKVRSLRNTCTADRTGFSQTEQSKIPTKWKYIYSFVCPRKYPGRDIQITMEFKVLRGMMSSAVLPSIWISCCPRRRRPRASPSPRRCRCSPPFARPGRAGNMNC